MLSHIVWSGTREDDPFSVSTIHLDSAKSRSLPETYRQMELLVAFIGRSQETKGAYVRVEHGNLRAKLAATNTDDESFIVRSADSEGLIEQRHHPERHEIRLTLKGLRLLQEIQNVEQGSPPVPVVPPASEPISDIVVDHVKDVFISHASEDKQDIARPLAEELKRRGRSVWFDEYELKWGDSLRARIDHGLAHSRFGIVILSTHFFTKRWPQAELDGLFAREEQGKKVILPIWHDITEKDVAQFSPILAGRLALQTDGYSVSDMADELERLLGKASSMSDGQ